MKKRKVVGLILAVIICMVAPVVSPILGNVIIAQAHGGKTDKNGGHKDGKNKSGLGSYHYHCNGSSAHTHSDGVCPYQSGGQSSGSAGNSTKKETASQQPTPKQTAPKLTTSKQAAPKQTEPQQALPQQTTSCQTIQNDAGHHSEAVTEGWHQDEVGWWYENADGTYPKSCWKEIKDKDYYFGDDGYLLVNRVTPDGHYVDHDGVCQ